MRPLVLAAALALLPAGRARALDPGAEAARSYRLETDGTTRQLSPGAKGKLVLAIVPGDGAHLQPGSPVRVTISASRGLKLSRLKLGRAEAVDPRAEAPRFEVPFTAAAGAQEARARVDFYLCTDRWCARQSRQVAVAIEVR